MSKDVGPMLPNIV